MARLLIVFFGGQVLSVGDGAISCRVVGRRTDRQHNGFLHDIYCFPRADGGPALPAQ